MQSPFLGFRVQHRAAPLPVGETGGSKDKGEGRGGGSPKLHEGCPGNPRKVGDTRLSGRLAFTLVCARGKAPEALACERGRYLMAKTALAGLGSPALKRDE